MEVWYLVFVIAMIVVLFIVAKRPMYEIMLLAFIIVTIISGNAHNFGKYIYNSAFSSVLYATISFVAFSVIFSKTSAIDDFMDLIVALVGRFSGGAGYVALLMCSMMGSLAGSGPGNAAAIGAIVIPAMKKTGYSSELAATVAMAGSSLGPVIPPSASLIISYTLLTQVFPEACTFSQFWLFMWGISLWYIVQRIITLFFLIRKLNIPAIPKEERPPVGESLKKGWKSLLLPVVVLAPFILESTFSDTFITARLGEAGANVLSGALLVLVPSIAVAYVLLISKDKFSLKSFMLSFKDDAIPQIAPLTLLVFSAYSLSDVFTDIGVNTALAELLHNAALPYWAVIVFVPLLLTVLGMFLEGTAIQYMVAPALVMLAADVGINPILMCGTILGVAVGLGHMTPPYALTFYIPMSIAGSEFGKTVKLTVVWCIIHYIFAMLIFMGILPVPGLVPANI